MIKFIRNLFKGNSEKVNIQLRDDKELYYYGRRMTIPKMNSYLDNEMAIHASVGGLILGPSHDQGGVYFWVLEGEHYILKGEVEGYEFILNSGANLFYEKSLDTFHQYEQHKTLIFQDYEPNSNIRILDTRSKVAEPKFLLFDDDAFGIVNKYSTKGFLNSLNELNNSISYTRIGEKTISITRNHYNDIDINFYDENIGYIPGKKKSG